MKLYDAAGPNPRVVRMFLLEKGLQIPAHVMVLGTGENRTPEHLARNALGQVPVLETGSGACISETTAICEYLEELHPEPVLIGRTPEQRGQTRMWTRRVDLLVCEPVTYAVGFSPFGARFATEPRAAKAMRSIANQNLSWLDSQLDGPEYLCGARFSLADILLYSFLDHAISMGMGLVPEWTALAGWYQRTGERPSAAASLESKVDSMALSGTV
jgi:glutathione S-transferase